MFAGITRVLAIARGIGGSPCKFSTGSSAAAAATTISPSPSRSTSTNAPTNWSKRECRAREAEQTARREFGNVTLMQERSREAWQWPALESLLADLKFVFRRLRKSPGFAVTVLLTLAIGNRRQHRRLQRDQRRASASRLPYPEPQQLVSAPPQRAGRTRARRIS